MPDPPEDTTIVEVDGHFSIYDTCKDILNHAEAKAAITEALVNNHLIKVEK